MFPSDESSKYVKYALEKQKCIYSELGGQMHISGSIIKLWQFLFEGLNSESKNTDPI